MSRKILLIVDDFLPHSIKVAAKMMYDLALSLKRKGNDVVVLTPLPSLSKKIERQEVGGVDVVFFKSGEIKNVSKVKRAINETLLSYNALKYAKSFFNENTFDDIIYYSPSIFFGFLVKKLKKKYSARTYLILRDIFPQWTVDNGLIKEDSLIHKYFSYFERLNYRVADKIGVMSEANLAFCKSKYQNPEKFEVLFNWTKINPQKNKKNKYRKLLGLGGKVIFFYGGNIGKAQNMRVLIDLAIYMKRYEQAQFLFVGKGDDVELVLKMKDKHKLDNVTYLPAISQQEYFQMLSEIDVGLFNLHPHHQTHNFPGKLLGYMEYSKPILGCVNQGNDLKEIVNEAEAGFIFEYEYEEMFHKKAENLLHSEDLRKKIGRNSFNLLQKKFDVEKIATQILT